MKTLVTKRLILRAWEETDVNDLYEFAKSELVGPSAGWAPHKNKEESKKILKMFIINGNTYAIVLKEENKVVGSIGLHNRTSDFSIIDLTHKDIGYVLNPNYWGRGIMPEAVSCLLKYGFDDLNLDLISCSHFDFNNKSKRVIEKSGFNYKFQKKEKLKVFGDKEVTTLCYNISKVEYEEFKKQI